MTFISSVVHEAIKKRSAYRQSYVDYGLIVQEKVLNRLMSLAKDTEFGKQYQFKSILNSGNFMDAFRSNIPVFDYSSMHDEWWHRCLSGEKNVCWPGKVKYFALTSGTSDGSSKRVPVTSDLIDSVVKTSRNQFLTLADYDLPKSFFNKNVLMLSGSTSLTAVNGHFEGDLSGILSGQLPFWFHHFYKPGRKIASEKNWDKKLDLITKAAKDWDVGMIVGVPAWIQLLLERIMEYYKLQNIHEIWPNLLFFIHGGVSFEPYKTGFKRYLGREIHYQETYLASEGYFAFQNGLNRSGLQLVLNSGTFFEFIPFNHENFEPDGQLKDNPTTYFIDEVEEDREYAIVFSTNGGAWRYLIGDTIKFTSLEHYEIIITGRTKHFISLCGEHLSIDNMNRAIESISKEFDLNIREFTVSGIEEKGNFGHKWFVGVDKKVDETEFKIRLDEILKELNDDYRTERAYALNSIHVKLLPNKIFYDWLKFKGKQGGQNKFPRVLKGQQLVDWERFVQAHTNIKKWN